MSVDAERPVPTPTAVSREHWDGCRRGELLYQRCDDCDQAIFPPAPACWSCASTSLSWHRSEGRGHVYTHSTVWRPATPAFEAPYVVAVVALDEGWHMFTNIIGCAPEHVHRGLRVSVAFVEVGDEARTVLPAFQPDSHSEERT